MQVASECDVSMWWIFVFVSLLRHIRAMQIGLRSRDDPRKTALTVTMNHRNRFEYIIHGSYVLSTRFVRVCCRRTCRRPYLCRLFSLLVQFLGLKWNALLKEIDDGEDAVEAMDWSMRLRYTANSAQQTQTDVRADTNNTSQLIFNFFSSLYDWA